MTTALARRNCFALRLRENVDRSGLKANLFLISTRNSRYRLNLSAAKTASPNPITEIG